jgi:hypothetical protein
LYSLCLGLGAQLGPAGTEHGEGEEGSRALDSAIREATTPLAAVPLLHELDMLAKLTAAIKQTAPQLGGSVRAVEHPRTGRIRQKGQALLGGVSFAV